jgi:acyl-CoA synthetase (AMP-forming)/AMP-acid ligase II
MFTDIMRHPRLAQFDISSLRVSIPSAALVPVELIERMRSELGIDMVLCGYGLTEAHATVTMGRNGDPPELIADTVGRPMAGVEVIVADDECHELPAGEHGEVLVRGYTLMSGYFNDPEATAEAIDRDGWLHTGDIGFFNDVGYLKITDRKKDMIISGGFNVYPAEIERVLLFDDAVADVAVVAGPDDRKGEVAVAFVVAGPGKTVDPAALLAMSEQHLARYKVPTEVRIVESLPCNASMKVLKHQLRDQLRDEQPTA